MTDEPKPGARSPHHHTAETPEEHEIRRASEERSTKIADVIKTMLPDGTGFVLVTATVGDIGTTTYLSNVDRADSVRLLSELLDHWKYGDAILTEPTVRTSAFLREQVKRLRGGTPVEIFAAMRQSVAEAGLIFDAGDGDAHEAVIHVMTAVTQGLALFENFGRYAHKRAAQEHAAARGGADAEAKESAP